MGVGRGLFSPTVRPPEVTESNAAMASGLPALVVAPSNAKTLT